MIALALLLISFLFLLFYYQRQDKIYIGYTTVLSLLYITILAFIFAIFIFSAQPGEYLNWILILIIWVLGSVTIYMTSQLTLAFEKIHQLSQYIAMKETNKTDHQDQTAT